MLDAEFYWQTRLSHLDTFNNGRSDVNIFLGGCISLLRLRLGTFNVSPEKGDQPPDAFAKENVKVRLFDSAQAAWKYREGLVGDRKALARIFVIQAPKPITKNYVNKSTGELNRDDVNGSVKEGLPNGTMFNYVSYHEPHGEKPYFEWVTGSMRNGKSQNVVHSGSLLVSEVARDGTRYKLDNVYGVAITSINNPYVPASRYDPRFKDLPDPFTFELPPQTLKLIP